MTIASSTSRIGYTGDGVTTAFAIPFFFSANSDLVVSFQDLSGNVTTKLLGTDYNLTGATVSTGGTCTFVTAPTTGFLIAITRVPPITQTASYNNNDPFPAKSHENALDKATTIDQYLKSLIDRAILVAPTDTPPMTTLPPAATRALKSLSFDASGNPTVTTPVTGSTVSAAMIPVTTASTLAIARQQLGVGDTIIAISTNTAISTAAQNSNRYIATGALNLTLAKADTFANGFGFWLEVVSTGGDVTLIPNAADTIAGALSAGQNIVVPAGDKVFITTNGAASGTWYIEGQPYLLGNVKRVSTTPYTITQADDRRVLSFFGAAFQTITFPAGSTLPPGFRCFIYNEESTAVGKSIVGVNVGTFTLYPGQGYIISNVNNVVTLVEGNLKRWLLPSATTFYVSAPGVGSDANDGLAVGRGFGTIQHGVDVICNSVDINRQNVVLQLADGTYQEILHLYNVTGWGTIGGHSELSIRGNLTTPANCVLSVANSNCFSMVGVTTPWRLEGYRMTVTSGTGNCVSCDGGSFVYIGKVEFAAAPNAHISASYFSFVEPVANYSIVAGAAQHWNAFTSSLIDADGITITLTGAPAFSSQFAAAFSLSNISAQAMTFVGTATGARYVATSNSNINVGGGGANYFPGNAVGSVSTGGQYN